MENFEAQKAELKMQVLLQEIASKSLQNAELQVELHLANQRIDELESKETE